MKANKIFNFINSKFPLSDQEQWDSSGSYFLREKDDVSGILLCLDINNAAVLEAIQKKCNVIIAHHPLVFKNRKPTKKEKKINSLLKANKISVICHHTNYDSSKIGMNVQLAKKIGLSNIRGHKKNNFIAVFGTIKETDMTTLSKQIASVLLGSPVYFSDVFSNRKISKVAIIGGSGFSYYKEFLAKKNIDLLLTGDMKWHDWEFAKTNDINVLDIGHDAENIFIDHYFELLTDEFSGVAIHKKYNYSDLKIINS